MKNTFTLRKLFTAFLFIALLTITEKSTAQIDATISWWAINGFMFEPCKGDPIEFENWGTGYETTWNWDFPGGNPSTSIDSWPYITYNAPGNYNVTLIVSDGLGNFDTSTQVITVYGFDVSETHINSTCADSSGSIDLTVANNQGYTYFYWYDGNNFTEDISNIPAGIHTVEINDDYCLYTYNVAVQNSDGPIPIETHSNIGCGNPFGIIDVTVSGGVPPYNYLWSNGANTQDLSNLLTGVYTLTVTDQTGCPGFAYITITDSSSGFYPYISAIQPNCTNNGELTATPNGGQPPYTYLWSNGETTQTITGLAAGNYSLTMSDNSGCQNVSVSNYLLSSACYNIIQGQVFIDLNGNCVFDAGENAMSNCNVVATNGSQNFYGYTTSNGNFTININIPGTFTTSAYSYGWAYGNCTSNSTCNGNAITFPSVGDTSTENDIGFSSSSQYNLDLHVTWSGANPGFDMHYNIYPFDQSATPYTGNSTVTFYYDAQLEYDYCNNPQPVHDSIAHTLTWTVNNLPNYFSWGYHLSPYFTVPVGTPTNYIVNSDFYIDPTIDDCDSNNNHLHTSAVVTGSYDPNEKEVSPAGNILNTDSVLTYTIHFQNTGNDTTHFVIVTDTLPSSLDPTTVVNLASSAPFSEFSISGTGILKWVFNPLFLPDSATNEPASKGFVMFKIKVKPNLPFGTTINNKASIYFDYNPAVITNYATNSIINGVEEITVNSEQLIVYPNPATDEVIINSPLSIINYVVVTDVLGREIYSQQANAQSSTINCQLYAAGIYFVKVQMGNGNVEVKRFVKE